MRTRLRYLTISPRTPQRFAGFLTGLIVLIVGVVGILVAGIVGPMVTHTAASAIATVAGL